MKKTDTEIHHTEMLITLDYLLRFTDEEHPATQTDICKHARTFGLKYDEKHPAGNDVRRQRIGECLKFLKDKCDNYPDIAPFVLEQTNGGKYYIESKNSLTEEQVIKILAAVHNDKYTKDDDTELFTERLLDALSNVHNREFFVEQSKKMFKGVKKYDLEANRKLRLVTKALNEGKALKIRWVIYGRNDEPNVYDFWYRVYKISEFNNRPYALLIPLNTGDIRFCKAYIFDVIENLNIPNLPDRDVLTEDMNSKRDLDKLFLEQCPWIKTIYKTPEEMLKAVKMPISAIAPKISFYFSRALLKFLKPSYESYFSTKMEYVECNTFDVLTEEETREKKDWYIKPHPLKNGERGDLCVVNTYIDFDAFMAWLMRDLHGDGRILISSCIDVVGPTVINDRLVHIYEKEAKRLKLRGTPRITETYKNKTSKD